MLQVISNLYSIKVYLNLTFDNQGSRLSDLESNVKQGQIYVNFVCMTQNADSF